VTRVAWLALVILGAASSARAQQPTGAPETYANVVSIDGRDAALGPAIEAVARAAVARCAPRAAPIRTSAGAYFYLRIAADGAVTEIEPAAAVRERPRDERRIEQWARCVQPHLAHMHAPAGPEARVTLLVGYTVPATGLYGGSAASPSVIMTLPTVTPRGFTREVARRVVRRHLNEVRFCYEQQLTASPALETDYTLVLDVDGTGTVAGAHATLTRTPSDLASAGERGVLGPLVDCLAAAGRRWAFPPPSRAVPVVVTVTGSLLLPW
jgi:hypothetical protein